MEDMRIEKLEIELANIQHDMRVNKYSRKSYTYQTLLNRQNRLIGALAYAKGEEV